MMNVDEEKETISPYQYAKSLYANHQIELVSHSRQIKQSISKLEKCPRCEEEIISRFSKLHICPKNKSKKRSAEGKLEHEEVKQKNREIREQRDQEFKQVNQKEHEKMARKQKKEQDTKGQPALTEKNNRGDENRNAGNKKNKGKHREKRIRSGSSEEK